MQNLRQSWLSKLRARLRLSVQGYVREAVLINTYRFTVIARCESKTDKKDVTGLARFLNLGACSQSRCRASR
jgi:hypothetical protein